MSVTFPLSREREKREEYELGRRERGRGKHRKSTNEKVKALLRSDRHALKLNQNFIIQLYKGVPKSISQYKILQYSNSMYN